jgi:hypothetical protein
VLASAFATSTAKVYVGPNMFEQKTTWRASGAKVAFVPW